MVVDADVEAGVSPYIDVIDTHLFRVTDGNIFDPVNPNDITAGMEVIPVIRLSYYRNIERFGLSLTVLKGQVFDGESKHEKTQNMDWVIDYPFST